MEQRLLIAVSGETFPARRAAIGGESLPKLSNPSVLGERGSSRWDKDSPKLTTSSTRKGGERRHHHYGGFGRSRRERLNKLFNKCACGNGHSPEEGCSNNHKSLVMSRKKRVYILSLT